MLNGIAKQYDFFSETAYFDYFDFIGPFTLAEMMNICWRLQHIKIYVKIKENFLQETNVYEFGSEIEEYHHGGMELPEHRKVRLQPRYDLLIEPYKRIDTMFEVHRQDFFYFELKGVFVDDINNAIDDETIVRSPIFYFRYSFYANGYRTHIANPNSNLWSVCDFEIKKIPFLGRELALKILVDHPGIENDITIEMEPTFYKDDDFADTTVLDE